MSKTSVNEKNLRALGEKHLSKLLLSLASEYPMEKLRLRYTLFHEFDPYNLEGELKKHLNNLTKNLEKTPPAKVPSLLDELSLQHQIIHLLKAIDPLQALKHQFDLLGALSKLLLIMEGKRNKRFGEAINLAQNLLVKFLNQLTALILEHPPEGKWLAQEFLGLPLHGGRCFRVLDDAADALGPQKIEVMRQQAEKICEKYQTIEDTRGLTHEEDHAFHWLCDLCMVFSLFKRDIETYLFEDRDDPGAVIMDEPMYLAKVAKELMEADLYKGAEACLTSIPTPPPSQVSDPWYATYNKVLLGLGKKEQARKIRWEFFTRLPHDADHLLFYLSPWLPSLHSDHSTNRYKEEVDRVEKFLMENVSPKEALLLCWELRGTYVVVANLFSSLGTLHNKVSSLSVRCYGIIPLTMKLIRSDINLFHLFFTYLYSFLVYFFI